MPKELRPHLPGRPYPWESMLTEDAQKRVSELCNRAGNLDDVAYALALHLSQLLEERTHVATETWVVVLRRAAEALEQKCRGGQET